MDENWELYLPQKIQLYSYYLAYQYKRHTDSCSKGQVGLRALNTRKSRGVLKQITGTAPSF